MERHVNTTALKIPLPTIHVSVVFPKLYGARMYIAARLISLAGFIAKGCISIEISGSADEPTG